MRRNEASTYPFPRLPSGERVMPATATVPAGAVPISSGATAGAVFRGWHAPDRRVAPLEGLPRAHRGDQPDIGQPPHATSDGSVRHGAGDPSTRDEEESCAATG